jgi:hypothetical protein
MGILSDIIDGIQKADAMPIGLVLGKSARPALDAGLKLKSEAIVRHGSAMFKAFENLTRSTTKEFPGWELLLDHGAENPYAKSDTVA